MIINNRQYIDCLECPRCKSQNTLKNGVKWGICGMSGNIVYLEPWKEEKVSGRGYIYHNTSSCGLFEKGREKM